MRMLLHHPIPHSKGSTPTKIPRKTARDCNLFDINLDYLFENFFNVLSAVFVAFLGRVAVYLLRTVESSGLLYAAGGSFNNRNQK